MRLRIATYNKRNELIIYGEITTMNAKWIVMISIIGMLLVAGAASAASYNTTNAAGALISKTTNNSVTYVKATFVVPTVTSTTPNTQCYLITGFSAVTACGVSIGTDGNGAPYYNAIYITPTGTTVTALSVAPGNTIVAENKYANGLCSFNITNGNSKVSYTKNVACTAKSAVWIALSPKNADGTYKMIPNFGVVNMTGAAKVSGTLTNLGSLSAHTSQMVYNGITKANGAISGNNAVITWKNAGSDIEIPV